VVPIKIAIVSDVAPPYIGGGEVITLNLAKRIAKNHEVVWITSRLPGTKPYEFVDGVEIRRFWIPFSKHYLRTRVTFSLISLPHIIGNDYDVVQFNSFVAAVGGSLYPFRNKIAFVWELFLDLWKNIGKNAIEKTLYPYVERIIAHGFEYYAALSNYSKMCLTKLGVNENRVKVVYPAIDNSLFEPSEPIFKKKKYTIGWCGRMGKLSWAKNLPCLLEAFKIIKKELKDVELLLAGPGWETFKEEVKHHNLKIGDDVRYIGLLKRE